MIRAWFVTVFAAAAVGCGGTSTPAPAQSGGAAAPAQGAAAPGAPSPFAAPAGEDGPGLRRAPAESLKLPVARDAELSHVQPAYVAAALGKDPARLFQFVRDEIAFEPYAGALRGPRGTLLAMAGNSVDRAALLASLLTTSGQRVRFARGRLPDDSARRLVASIWRQPRAAAVSGPVAEDAADLQAASEQLHARIERDSAIVGERLKTAGQPVPGAAAITAAALLDEARDHYWLEWSQNGAWTPLDPSFATANPGQTYAQAEQTFDALPDTVFHRIDLRLRVEEYTGTTRTTRDVLTYSARAADLSGADLVLTHAPGEDREAGRVRPTLDVLNEQIDGLAFWITPPAGQAFGGLADFLGGGGDNSSVMASAESIELDLIAPGGRKETVVRYLFDRVGPKRRLAGETLTAEQAAAGLGTAGTRELTGRIVDLFITTGAIDATHLTNLPDPPPPADDFVDLRAGLRRLNIAHAAVSDAITGRIAGASGQIYRSYVDTPRVQIADLSLAGPSPRLGLDLRRDQTRIVADGFDHAQLFHAQVLRGLIAGTLERVVVDYFSGSGAPQDGRLPGAFSTSTLFERAEAAKIPAVLVASGPPASIGGAPADALARIHQAQAGGQLIVAPQQAVAIDGAPRLAWWQIDARTGATIAVTDEGLHQAVTAVLIRYKGFFGVAIRVNGRFLPRSFRFASRGQANRFIGSLGNRLRGQGLKFNWYSIL